jgi:RNA polymerase sigma-70 factor (ECF subfamily)
MTALRVHSPAATGGDSLDRLFREIHNTFRPKILRYLARLVGEPEAEDLTQDVFVKVQRGLLRFRGDASLSTWIYRIATNAAVDRMRRTSTRRNAELKLLDRIDVAGGGTSLDQHLIRKDMYACFGRFINRLPVNYRAAVVLSDVEEFTDQEIAAILGLSVRTVKIRLHRGRAKLLQVLRSNCRAEDWLCARST